MVWGRLASGYGIISSALQIRFTVECSDVTSRMTSGRDYTDKNLPDSWLLTDSLLSCAPLIFSTAWFVRAAQPLGCTFLQLIKIRLLQFLCLNWDFVFTHFLHEALVNNEHCACYFLASVKSLKHGCFWVVSSGCRFLPGLKLSSAAMKAHRATLTWSVYVQVNPMSLASPRMNLGLPLAQVLFGYSQTCSCSCCNIH